jgi:hypothetical protein
MGALVERLAEKLGGDLRFGAKVESVAAYNADDTEKPSWYPVRGFGICPQTKGRWRRSFGFKKSSATPSRANWKTFLSLPLASSNREFL